MTFQQLSFVVEVANCESINKAAERLYTSQSNVSNSIKALEEELGIQIFLRTKKGVSVTEEGREFLSYANEIIDKKIFVEDLYAKSHFRKQYFSVSSMRSFFLSTPITRLWPQISDGHGGSIYIRLKKQSFYDVLDDVQHCRSDLGIVFLMKSHSNRITRLCSVKDLDYHLLGESHISIVTRADHPILQAQETVPVEDRMTDYPYVQKTTRISADFTMMIPSPSLNCFSLPQNASSLLTTVLPARILWPNPMLFSSVLPAGSIRSTTIFPRSRLREKIVSWPIIMSPRRGRRLTL